MEGKKREILTITGTEGGLVLECNRNDRFMELYVVLMDFMEAQKEFIMRSLNISSTEFDELTEYHFNKSKDPDNPRRNIHYTCINRFETDKEKKLDEQINQFTKEILTAVSEGKNENFAFTIKSDGDGLFTQNSELGTVEAIQLLSFIPLCYEEILEQVKKKCGIQPEVLLGAIHLISGSMKGWEKNKTDKEKNNLT